MQPRVMIQALLHSALLAEKPACKNEGLGCMLQRQPYPSTHHSRAFGRRGGEQVNAEAFHVFRLGHKKQVVREVSHCAQGNMGPLRRSSNRVEQTRSAG